METVRRGDGELDRLAAIVAEQTAVEVVVGLPVSLSGQEGQAAAAARDFARALAGRVAPCPVRLVDERLSTVAATRALRESGISARRGRSAVDQAAAVVILQGALDAERESGRPPGEIVQVGG
jgi:putative holliday junction resolvase